MRYFENNFYCQKHSFSSEPLREISKIICAHLYYFKWLHPFPNFNYLLLQNFSRLTKYISNSYLFFFQIVILYCGDIVICVCLCGQMSAFFEIYFCLKKIQISLHCESIIWREVGGGFRMGNTCIPVVDSFCVCF